MQTSLLFKNNGLVFVFKSHNPLVVGSNPTGPTNQINALRKQGIFSCRNCVQVVSLVNSPIPSNTAAWTCRCSADKFTKSVPCLIYLHQGKPMQFPTQSTCCYSKSQATDKESCGI